MGTKRRRQRNDCRDDQPKRKRQQQQLLSDTCVAAAFPQHPSTLSDHAIRPLASSSAESDTTATSELIKPLPDGVHHYDHYAEVPEGIQHYFRQRYKIWSRYDDGVWMTDAGWYGVSQERVAAKIAEHVALMAPVDRSVLVDVFCGVGGNTIGFALSGRWKRIYAIEKDAAALACARRNAEIYGVEDKITWFLGDCFELLGDGKGAVDGLRELVSEFGIIFGSPPWGGPEYRSADIFDLKAMQPYSLDGIIKDFIDITKNIVLYLPRTSDLRQIAECVPEGKRVQVVHYCTKGNSRALCVYMGDFRGLTHEL